MMPAENRESRSLPTAGTLNSVSEEDVEDVVSTLSQDAVRLLFEATQQACVLIDAEGHFQSANTVACELFQIPLQSLLQKSLREYLEVADEDEDGAFSFPLWTSKWGKINLKIGAENILELDFFLIANVDEYTHLLVFQYPSEPSSRDGNRTCDHPTAELLECVCHDLPDTQAQLHLQSVALNACADAILITDREGTIEWVNPAFTHLTGYTPDAAIGRNPRDLVNSGRQDQAFFQNLWATILAGEIWRGELINRRKDYSLYVEKMTITPIYGQDDEISHFIAIKQDVTAQRQAEQRQQELTERVQVYAQDLEQTNQSLQLSEQRYRSIVETQTELICRFRPDGTLTFVNDAYASFVGSTPASLVGQNFLNFIPERDRALVAKQIAELRQLTPENSVMSHEHPVRSPDGQVGWQHWINQAIFDDQGQLLEFQAAGRDVTDLKQATQALHDREQQLELFFTQSLDGCFFMMLDEPIRWDDTVDKETVLDYVFTHQRVTKANQALLEQYGCTEAEFLGRTPADFFAHDLALGRAVWRQFFDVGRQHLDTNECKADGSSMWIEGDYICLYDEQGRITGHLGVQREVTGLKATIAALKASETNYRLLVENQTDLVVKVDTEGRFLFVSPSYCDLFGRSAEALLGSNFMPLVHEDDRAATQAAMAALQHPPHTCQLEQRALTRKGWRWLAWSDKAILDEQGNIAAIVGVGRDITDRKHVEQELQLSEQRFRNVLETLSLIAIMLDTQGNVVFCNDAFLALTGWSREAVIGSPWFEQFVPAEVRAELLNVFDHTLRCGEFPSCYENEIVTRQGDRRLIAWNNTVQQDAQGRIISITSVGEDITERKQYETNIFELSQRLTLATSSLALGIWDWELTTQRLHWDDRMFEIYGLDPKTFENVYETWQGCLLAEDLPVVAAQVEAAIAGPDDFHAEFRIRRPVDGEIRYIEAHAVVLRDARGHAQRLTGVNRDITARKRSEAAIQETTQRLSLATEAAQMGIWDFDIKQERLVWDDRMCEIYGISPAMLTGQYDDWVKRVHPDDQAVVHRQSEALLKGRQFFQHEFRIVRPDGEIRYIESHGRILRDETGCPLRVTGVNLDISDRKANEATLQETTDRLTLATDAVQLGIWDWHVVDDCLTWDERMHALYGVAEEEFAGRYADWLNCVHPDDRPNLVAAIAAIDPNETVFHAEFRIMRPDGEIRYIEDYAILIRDDAGQLLRVIGVNLDITDRKTAELELAEVHQQLQALMKNSPAIIGLYDETGRYQQVNAITSAYLGLEETDIVGRRFEEVLSPEVAALFMERVRRVAATNQPTVVEDRLLLMDKEHIFRSVLFPVLDRPGKPKLLGMVATDITPMIEAQQSLQRQAERERLMRELTENIRRSLDLDTILESTVTGVRQFLQTDRVLVYRFNADGSGDTIVESVGTGWLSVLGQTLRDPCFVSDLVEQYRRGHIGLINDVDTEELTPCYRNFLAHYQVRANLVLPVVVNKRLWGLLCLHHCQSPRVWKETEVEFAQQIADQVEIAIQQAKLLQETTVRAQRERLRNLITQHIRRSLDLDTILDATVHEIRNFLQTDRVLIYRFAPDWSGDIIVESVETGWTATLGSTLRDPCFEGDLLQKYLQGAISRLDDIMTAPIADCYRDFLAQFEIRANLVLPLIVEERLWGLLCIHHCRAPRHWQDDEITFVRQVCGQVEIGIQQAQLLEQTTLRAQQEQLFNEIMTTVRESLDLQEMMNRTTEKLIEAFQVSRCIVSLCSSDSEFLECSATAAVPGLPSLKHQRLPIKGNPLAEYILNAHGPIAKEDLFFDDFIANVPNRQGLLALAERFDIVAVLAIAIRYQGQVKGLLAMHHSQPRCWTEADCRLIQQVADQLAIAIQQAELYQQAQAEIAERMRLEEQLRHDAFHDALTGLPNRALFLDRLQFALQRFQRWNRRSPGVQAPTPTDGKCKSGLRDHFAVLFLDLDRFKVINDSLGHSFGDQLLKLVAKRLNNCLREVDMAARLGGDEFVILLEELAEPKFAIEVAQRIHNVLEVPIFLDGREVFIRASIGIAFGATHYAEPNQILRDADIAMYQAKQSNEEYVVFDASMHTIALQQMNLENDLRHAIKRGEFRLHFQPIVSLATGEIVSFEALVRWQHPTRGLLYPGAFVEVAEETGLIAAIDLWVLQEACHQLYRWQTELPNGADLSVSVNLSGKQFSQPDLISQIDYALASSHLDGRYLKLEITESVLIENNDLAIQTLDAFRARNIQVCMDDFGTGYSSLSYLHRFPVDILKIDKSFILNLSAKSANSRDYEIVKAIINLALNLNLQVVAEGVENQDVLVYLQKNRCQFGQGYFFSAAVDSEVATRLLVEQAFK